jgi:DNA-binding NarL/FixJ family response regulator
MEKFMEYDFIHVLLIEDHNLFRKTMADVINRSDHMICEYNYSTCEEALEDISRNDLAPDVVLLDINLPGMSGVEGLPHIKKICPNAKIIMLTVHGDDDHIFKAICAGASGYLLKKLSSEKIIDSINEVIKGGAPMNSHIAKKVLDMFKKLTIPSENYNLTEREKEILKHLVDGLGKKEIAALLIISYHTVDMHIRHIYEKLEVHNRSGAVAKALKEKLL